jgi:ABC-type transport system involved in multi-copper enzyme maturation permease subunit
VLAKFDVFRVMFMPNVGAWITPGGLDIPSGRAAANGSYANIHMSSLQGLTVLLVYVLVLGLAAIWSFTRRDVQ